MAKKERMTPKELREKKSKNTGPDGKRKEIPWHKFNPVRNFNRKGAQRASSSIKKAVDRKDDTLNMDLSAKNTYGASPKDLLEMRKKKLNKTTSKLNNNNSNNNSKGASKVDLSGDYEVPSKGKSASKKPNSDKTNIQIDGGKPTKAQQKANKRLANQDATYEDLIEGSADLAEAKAKLAAAKRGERTEPISEQERTKERIRQNQIDRRYRLSHDDPLMSDSEEDAQINLYEKNIGKAQQSLREQTTQKLANKASLQAQKMKQQSALDQARTESKFDWLEEVMSPDEEGLGTKDRFEMVNKVREQLENSMQNFKIDPQGEDSEDNMAPFSQLPEDRKNEILLGEARRRIQMAQAIGGRQAPGPSQNDNDPLGGIRDRAEKAKKARGA